MLIVGFALAEALVGLQAMWSRELPRAEVIDGVWLPGGTFEYPPALAILQASAIPLIVFAFSDGRRWIPFAALGALSAGAVISLSGDRLAFGLAAVFLAAMVIAPSRVGVQRHATAITVALVLAGAIVAPAMRSGAPADHRQAAHPRHAARTGDVLHGRTHELSAAFATWMDRPLLGAGAGAYLPASAIHQGRSAVLFAHDLPLELAAELGMLGLLLGVALYLTSGALALGATTASGAVFLAAPVAAFLASNLLDWTWHLAALSAVWAAACGALAGAREREKEGRTVWAHR